MAEDPCRMRSAWVRAAAGRAVAGTETRQWTAAAETGAASYWLKVPRGLVEEWTRVGNKLQGNNSVEGRAMKTNTILTIEGGRGTERERDDDDDDDDDDGDGDLLHNVTRT